MLITFQLSVLTGRSHVLFFRESADTTKGPCGPFVIRYSEAFVLTHVFVSKPVPTFGRNA
ncbi:hypothetical protein OHAE_1793 [Ochrobactrum soli]|uniref:Uncharacterized protein n=1 Tax=Ochrobactrum soli TaxID=2448455 RepID=A0A2P9HP53_9HYPH|nr:hypothetical protein OHAE_1793 [[Ochrobactrum] soli]